MLTDEQIAMLLALAGVVLNKNKDQILADLKADDAKAEDFKAKAKEFGASMLKQGEDKVLPILKKAVKKTLKIAIDDDVKDVDTIVTAIDTAITQKAEAEPDEAKVKASQAYKDLQTALTKKEEEAENLKTANQKELIKVHAANDLLSLRSEINAIIPEDAEAAKLKWELVSNALLGAHEFEQTDGDYFIKKADGTYETNANGHKVTLKEKGKTLMTAIYGISTVNPRQNANPTQQGNPAQQQQQQGTYKFYKPETHGKFPTTQAELDLFKADFNVPPQARQEVSEAYAKQQQPA